MATFSKVQIASNALILLGDEPISSFNDPGAGAKAAGNLYESSYLSILKSHRWNFATQKAVLARLVEVPKNEYKYQFQLPTDIVLLITTYPVSTYRILGDKLYSDSLEIQIDYIFRIDESQLPAYFIKAFEYYLATQLSIPITEDLNKHDLIRKMYERESRSARYADSQSQPSVAIVDTPYIIERSF